VTWASEHDHIDSHHYLKSKKINPFLLTLQTGQAAGQSIRVGETMAISQMHIFFNSVGIDLHHNNFSDFFLLMIQDSHTVMRNTSNMKKEMRKNKLQLFLVIFLHPQVVGEREVFLFLFLFLWYFVVFCYFPHFRYIFSFHLFVYITLVNNSV
ncbi:hypothetical protein ACJX0J_021793, partial [Zea mays]